LFTDPDDTMPIPAATKLLEKLAADLSRGDIVFPTCFNITIKVRDLLRDPDLSIDKLAHVLQAEPMISTKLMRMANSAALGPAGGSPVKDLNGAIMRLGLESVKTAAFAIAMAQLARSKNMSAYTGLSSKIWQHSILVAAIARQLARHFRRGKPDEAFFAGLVHDIGAFYLLHYACDDNNLVNEPEAIMDLIVGWHDGIGHALLDALGQQSEELLNAVQDHESIEPLHHLNSLSDVLRAANWLANRSSAWHDVAEGPDPLESVMSPDEIAEILEQSQADVVELQGSLSP
jgi:HD-like signal output (HDOD) protein